MKRLTYLIIVLVLTSCGKEKTQIEQTFNDEEAKTMFQIVEFFDEFVQSKTSSDIPIEEAYIKFLDKYSLDLARLNDLSPMFPIHENQVTFYSTLDSSAFSQIFHVKNSSEAYNMTTKLSETVPYPYYLSFNYEGKYRLFLENMGKETPFMNNLYEDYLSFDYYWSLMNLLNNYDLLDFSSIDERLVYTVGWLKMNEELIIQ